MTFGSCSRNRESQYKKNYWFSFLLISCLTICFCSGSASAQVLYGTLTGTLQDNAGAIMPDKTLTLTSQETGESRSVQTDSNGNYLFVNLLPGKYNLNLEAFSGFAAFEQLGIPVQVNRQTRIDITLQLRSVTEKVVVDASAPVLQTETAEVNHEISQTLIAELPITSGQGRNFQALYTLIPGFAAVGEQNSAATNPSRAVSANVNGTETMGVSNRIDGAMNQFGWLPYLIAYVPPADAIQSVNIVTNSFNAEQGMAGGASVNVTIKGGQKAFHGSAWEYNQVFNANARGYVNTPQAQPKVPKNIFNQFGATLGGPVYIPRLLTGRKKLFFFEAFERTTRRQLLSGFYTVPTLAMIGGDFSAVSGLTTPSAATILYDPQPGGVVQSGVNSTSGYLNAGFRPTFLSEYGCNCIPASRISPQAARMLELLKPISGTVGTPTAQLLNSQLSNDYLGSGNLEYNRMTNDSKITYVPSEQTTIFGRYSIEPYSLTDPQQLGNAGGGTFDGGQSGAARGRVQNVGIGFSHILTSNLVIDGDLGFTRQRAGAQSLVDIAAGDFGRTTLGIPGTNGDGQLYAGQPAFQFTGFGTLGNANLANPFLFRDNQFTGDVNVSWTKGKHSTKYGFGLFHFLLNHFQPTSGGGIQGPRGGFLFQGGMTTGPLNVTSSGSQNNINAYTSFADFLLGLPNNGTGNAVGHAYQISNPNSMRWSNYAAYAQDQWKATSKLSINYGVRYEFYPTAYRDHSGIFRLDPNLPQTANVIIGGVNGNPKDTGVRMSKLSFTPRAGIAYRVSDKLVVRLGAGISTDPDSLRFLRDSFPVDQAPAFAGTAANTIAINPDNKQALTLAVGIPNPPLPDLSKGFVSLPISGSTTTIPQFYRRGYIESWNLFIQREIGSGLVANIGYVGTHQVRQLTGYTLNAAPLPDGTTICMANGQYNPSTGLKGSCNFASNTLINTRAGCNSITGYTCYNTGGIGMTEPKDGSNYNGLQTQLTGNYGRLAQFGVSYTWSHAFNYSDNGGGSGSGGVAFSYPAYFKMNRATASYDRTHNLQLWGIYHLPFGRDQQFFTKGIASAILGGFQLNGQVSHISGSPFSISPSNSNGFNAPGNTLYADLVKPYKQLGGHNRIPGASVISNGKAWFDPSSFANPVQPTYSSSQTPTQIVAPHFGNTHRNQFRGPGTTLVNASVFRGFHVYRESQFQIRVEAFNLFNHPQLSNPNTTVGGGTFGYITSFGSTRSLQFSGRFNF